MVSTPRPAFGAAGRGVRALDADAALPPPHRRPDHRQAPVGHSDERRPLAPLLRRRALGLRAVLRDRSRSSSGCSGPRPGSHPDRGPATLAEGVLAGVPAGCLPARRGGRTNLSRAGDRGRPLPSGTGRQQPVRPGLRPSLPGLCSGTGQVRSRSSVARSARRSVGLALQASLRALRRRPRSPAGTRQPLRRLRTPGADAWRHRPPQGSGRRVLGRRGPLLVGVRRSLPRHRPRRCLHRPATLQRRAVRPRPDTPALACPAGRRGDGRRD